MKKYMSIILLLCMILVGSLTIVYGATKTKSLSWSTNYGGASEKITCTVTLSTVNKPSFSYSKNGYGAYYNGVSYKYAGISNSVSKTIKGDTGTYKITSQPSWTNSVGYANVKGNKKYTTFTYKGSLS